MKGIAYGAILAVALGIVIWPPGAAAQPTSWQVFGAAGGYVAGMVQDPLHAGTFYAVAYNPQGTVFKTTDQGMTWQQLGNTIGSPVQMEASCDGQAFYVCTMWATSMSTDGGAHWTAHYISPNSSNEYRYAYKYAADPGQANVLFAAGYIYKSGDSKSYPLALKTTDRGVTWSFVQVSTNQGYLYAVAVDTLSPRTVYACGYEQVSGTSYYDGCVYRSTDGGSSFAKIAGTLQGFAYDITVDRKTPSRVFVGTSNGVYRSTNSGQSWLKSSTSFYGGMLALDTQNPTVVYAVSNPDFYRSTDGGQTFSKRSTLPSTTSTWVTGELGSGHVLFTSAAGLHHSADGGQTWELRMGNLHCADITVAAPAPSSSSVVYLAHRYDAVYKTTDALAQTPAWSRIPDFYSCTSLTDLVVSRNDPQRLYALEGGT